MPLISVSGTQNIGKTTFINDFLEVWPMYKKSGDKYREIIKKRGLKINKETTKETQKIILEAIVEDFNSFKSTDNVIFDRTPLDNLVYSIWAYDKDKGDIDDSFIADCIKISRESLRRLSVMFLIPIYQSDEIKLEKREGRDVDPVFRKEIDTLFQGFRMKREHGDNVFFVKDDAPPIIEIFGNREERIEMTKLYLRPDGGFYGDEDSLILDSNGDFITTDNEIDTGERDLLRRQLGLDK